MTVASIRSAEKLDHRVSYPNFRKTDVVNEKELCAIVLIYLPFMVAVPQLAYHYELICVLPMIPPVSWFWENNASPTARKILTFVAVGIASSQYQAVAAEKLVGSSWPHFVPGFGLFIVIVGTSVFRLYISLKIESNQLLQGTLEPLAPEGNSMSN